MIPPTNDRIKEWANSHLANIHDIDPNSPIIEECLLMSRLHFITGVLKAIEYFNQEEEKKVKFLRECFGKVEIKQY